MDTDNLPKAYELFFEPFNEKRAYITCRLAAVGNHSIIAIIIGNRVMNEDPRVVNDVRTGYRYYVVESTHGTADLERKHVEKILSLMDEVKKELEL